MCCANTQNAQKQNTKQTKKQYGSNIEKFNIKDVLKQKT